MLAQFLKCDLMRQFDTHVSDFMDSLIEESASLEPAPVSSVFSPPLSDKERNKLGYHLTSGNTIVGEQTTYIIDLALSH